MADYVENAEFASGRLTRGTREWSVWALNARLLRGAEILNAALVGGIRDLPLTLNEAYTLTLLQDNPRGQLSHTSIAELTFSSTSTITNRVDRLESRNLVRRVPDPRDRRGILVEITADGREAALVARSRTAKVHASWLRELDDAELERVNADLRQLLEILETPDVFAEAIDATTSAGTATSP